MAKVHFAPWWWAAGGVVALFVVDRISPLPVAGWVAGLGYLAVSSTLLSVGLARRGMLRFGAANAVTATRSTLVAVVTALVVASFFAPVSASLVVIVTVPALILDAVDGWIARRTRGVTALGARFDMEVDAFLMLALSVYLVPVMGWWVLCIGLMRYAFVAAGWVLPWMRGQLPPRYWRKVVTAVCGISLTLAASGLVPQPVAIAAAAIALGLLIESFGRDVVWLAIHRTPEPSRPIVRIPYEGLHAGGPASESR